MPEPEENVTDETRAAEQVDETQQAAAGSEPTPEEEAAADRTADSGAKVADAYEESIERGANVKGEGEIP